MKFNLEKFHQHRLSGSILEIRLLSCRQMVYVGLMVGGVCYSSLGYTQPTLLETKHIQHSPVTENTKTITTSETTTAKLIPATTTAKTLSFDDLEHYDLGNVDQNMLNEIYRVAEQAKKDAEIWQKTGQSVVHTAPTDPSISQTQPIQDSTNNPTITETKVPAELLSTQEIKKVDIDQLSTPIDVTQLMQEIQESSQRVENTIQNTDQMDILLKSTNPEPTKGGWWAKWRAKQTLPKIDKVDYIHVDVVGATSEELETNIKAKLSTITVESFKEDYQALLPQLRSLTNQAAQAVGYYDVEFQFKAVDKDRLKVTIKQPEPVRVQSQEIDFTGAGELLPQFQVVKIVPDLEIGDIFHHGLYTKTKERITDAASNNGFFDGYWRLHDVKVTLPENTADIHLKYDTGDRYTLGDVQFRMSDEKKPLPIDEAVLRRLIPWKVGDDYTSWRVNLFNNYLTNTRYFNSISVNAVIPDPIQKELDLPPDVLKAIEKQKASVHDTPVTEVKNVNEATTFVGLDEQSTETTQDQQKSEKEQDRLQVQARENKQIPVIVTLNADKLNSLETGLGYATDTGFRIRNQYRRAIVNRHGHSFQANMELSEIRQAIDGRYSIPYPHAINRYISLLGGYERESDLSVGRNMSLVTESAVLGADYTRKTNRKDSWQHDIGLRYRLDRLSINGNVDPSYIPPSFVVVYGTDTQQSLLLSYKTSRLYANSILNITQGFKQSYKVEVGSKHLLTDVDMAILSAGYGFIYSFGENDNHQLIGRADGSYMFTRDFNKVPYNLRFFTGGDQSIRGFDYKSLSPTDRGIKIGGQALAIGSLEYNYQLVDGWRLGIFSDFGNSFDKNFNNPIEYSIGLGVRWQSPVGPIRIDIASGLSEPSHPVRLHFFIGPAL